MTDIEKKRAQNRARKKREEDRQNRGVIWLGHEVPEDIVVALTEDYPQLNRLEGKAFKDALGEALVKTVADKYKAALEAADDITY